MTEQLAQALKNLRDILQTESHEHCVAVTVFVTNQGYNIDYQTRTPGSLVRDGLSMRNLKGEYIK